ncbi:TPA: host-nuclease inhibitor protein Gam [Escherichia coli]|uniref:Phage host-nuclease inhibitor protein Gam n=12 Tax=Enterobacteriaceae TaxID=543 RepID=A0A979GGF9_ECOSE|nr:MULTISPECIES: host-nuclease inhibitor Gam family protein [Escherichia]EAB1830282.1 host-nuclease inhibitor protein Gam [Salmonella enterica]EAM6834385.1 host-nuclease inhibitor protein Gam [Salmonella enterica subsp. enterica serovar Adelaide]ECG2844469.1 host-nuclease inhibitor protein Gam [Salmonella enterica subsp. enterica serovar Manhattan]ECO2990379.1 host-nuclease inhibitor protein Gam [Salmonella enterica subsp. enterica serovar Braenderup]EDB2642666.1 host-nuclease inhibitor protei
MAKPAKRIKSAAAAYVPQNRDAVITDIKRIGDLQREASRLETEMNDAIAEITEKFAARIAPLKTDIETLSKGVQGWCEANRDELTNGGKVKTANLVTGDVSWRVRPPSVSIRGMDAVMETLERLGLQRFIRTKQEINKEAILNEPGAVAGVAGITVKSGIEDFSIIPFEQEAGI